MVYNSWSVSVRKMFRVDRATHRYMIEPLSKSLHVKTSLLKRFQKFQESLQYTGKRAARFVCHVLKEDCRSTFGKNSRILRLHLQTYGPLGILQFFPTPKNESWRLDVMKDLVEMRDRNVDVGWSNEEVNAALKEVCTS